WLDRERLRVRLLQGGECVVAGSAAACGVGRIEPGSGATGAPGATGNSNGRAREMHLRVNGNGAVRGGTFDCPSDCRVSLDKAAHLEASPDAGWKFDGWQGDCAGIATCDLDMIAD